MTSFTTNDGDNTKIEKLIICQFDFFAGLRKTFTDDTALTLAVARTLNSHKQIGMIH